MGLWNLGSIGSAVLELVPDIPDNTSGALLGVSERRVQFVEEYTGQSVGSVDIGIKYQGILTNFVAGDTLRSMELQGADAGDIKLGDFSIKKGKESNLKVAGDGYKEAATEDLRAIGRKSTTFQAFNG